MLLTVPDPGLALLLESREMILEMWGDAAREVMVLMQLLHHAAITLADVIAVGIVAVTTCRTTHSALVLQYRRVSLAASGRRADGTEVTAAENHPEEVERLEIHEVRITALVRATG